MSAEIIYGVVFGKKPISQVSEELHELANKIFAEALDVGGPDLWAGRHHPEGIEELWPDGKQPA